ncbi:caspase-3 [Nephila pilipes]|uniref:Caspase-3 n=1 Tax=Nephila pilipes TaxID=299642 RepID=A0A8X6NDS1_NEPPI|nr:caspase-3 [Nephila pilipes]
MATSDVKVDAIPVVVNDIPEPPPHILDEVMHKLTENDYRSIFFLLIEKIKLNNFSFLIWKDEKYMQDKFRNIYYEFRYREALLIEILGTMQKYESLKLLGTCKHIFERDKETFTQINSKWKCLYEVCDQLTDGEVEYLKEKLFPDNSALNLCCAEELFCLAFLKDKLQENNWRDRLAKLFKDFHPDCYNLIISFKDSKLNYYPVRRPTKLSPCGIAVIMNHVKFYHHGLGDRPESSLDAEALKKLWESYGFTTKIHMNLTDKEVFDVFKSLSKMDHSHYDVFVACYLSHGDEGVVYPSKGDPIKLSDLLDIMSNDCETLVGKPKLFFVQACQGRQIQTGIGNRVISEYPRSETRVRPSRLTKNAAFRSDVLMYNSSIEGYVSFREGRGSWFISELVTEIEKHGEEMTIINVLTKVEKNVTEKEGIIFNSNITTCKQTPVMYNTLTNELKLKKLVPS